MGFVSILGPDVREAQEGEYPSFYQDLNIDLIVDRILLRWSDAPIRQYFMQPSFTREGVRFRRDVYEQLQGETFRERMLSFSERMKNYRTYLSYRERLLQQIEKQQARKETSAAEKTASEVKYQHLLYDAAKSYVDAVQYLHDLLSCGSFSFFAEGFLQLREYVKDYCEGEAFLSLQKEVAALDKALRSLHFQFEVKQNKLTIYDDYDETDLRQEFMDRCGMKEEKKPSAPTQMQSPFPNVAELKEFEGLILSMLHQPKKEVFAELASFAERYESFADPLLLRFDEQIQVYLAAHQFFDEMRSCGFSFVQAEEQKAGYRWFLRGNYDAALACKHSLSPEKVVANDSYLLDGEQFFVITGPNQGGKTTFARAAGQAVYFHQMGFPVPGDEAALPVFSELLTHFPQEEDSSMDAGRLKEELLRLSPMLKEGRDGGFVILNELFTTATSYDANIMGERILRHFIGCDYIGIYVTHFHKLAKCSDHIVSLVAQVEDTDEKKRTFRILREPAKGIAYAQTFAQKYRLSKEEIIERVGGGACR